MAANNTIAIKLTLLADGVKQGLANAKQGFENLNQAASAKVANGLTDNLTDKLKLVEAELKKAKEDLDRLKTALNGKSGPLADSITQEIGKAEAKIRQTEAELDKLKSKLNSAASNTLASSAKTALDETGKSAGVLRNTLDKTLGDVKGMIAGAFAVSALVAFSKRLVDTVKEIQDLRIRLSGLTLSAQDYAASEAYLIDLSKRHHKSVQDLTGSYSAFLTLERSGIITRQQSMQLLEGFSNLASKTGASAVQMGQSIYGLSQALGTGVVNMQDFRQIVEPMPGLANEIAKSMGLTVGQLRELIATGTLTSEEFGRKVPAALKAYEGAAARSAGTLSASYADVNNAFTAMATTLEKPIATSVTTVLNDISAVYKVLRENGDSVITVVTAIAVVMAGKAVSAMSAYTKAGIQSIQVEQAHTAAIIENERRTVSARAAKVAAAEAKNIDRIATAELAAAEVLLAEAEVEEAAAQLAVVQAGAALTPSRIANLKATFALAGATNEAALALFSLAESEALVVASSDSLIAAELRLAQADTQLAAATNSQAAANSFLVGQNAKLAESQRALTAASNMSGVAMTRLKSAMAFVGGPVGVAVIALWGLYEILNKINDTEGKAEEKAKAYDAALKQINDTITKLNANEVTLQTASAQSEAEELHKKIAKLEEFKFSNIKDFWGNADKRQVLLDDLKITEEKLKALNQQDLELIKNFDATKLDSQGQLKGELDSTQTALRQLSNEAEKLNTKLHQQGKLAFYEQKQLDEDNLRISAFEAKESALQKQIEVTSGATQEVLNKKKRAASKATIKGIEDDLKEVMKAEDAEAARRNELAQSSLASRKAEIELSTASTLQKELLITQATKAANDAQLMIIANTASKKLRINQETFDAEIEKAKVSKSLSGQLDEQSLLAKLDIYRGMEKSYSETVTRLVNEEVRLVNESKAIAEQRKGIEQSYADFKLQLHQLELTDGQKKEEDITRLKKIASDQKKAIADGDFKTAEELNLKILELGKAIALSDKQKAEEAKKSGKLYFDSVSEVVAITDKAQASILKVNDAAQDATKQRMADAKAGAEAAKTQLQDVQEKIATITKELTAKRFMLMMDVDDHKVLEAIAQISKPTSSTHTINVIENRVQAHAGGGAIYALNTYASGGGVTPPELFTRKQGAISGKGTGTSDEVPAMLSNGEYVITAEKVAKWGVAEFDKINYGNKSPAQVKMGANPEAYATGGAVGDDRIAQKTAELKKQQYETVKSYFDTPATQVLWSMTEGMATVGFDANTNKHNFERRAGDYLRLNGLPHEFLELYMKGIAATDVLTNTKSSVEEKAKAQIELEDQFAKPPATPQAPTPAAPAQPSFAPAPVLAIPAPTFPSITPANFSPVVSHAGTPTQISSGKTSTVKFVSPDGNTTTGQSSDPNFATFFDNLNTVAGVTR